VVADFRNFDENSKKWSSNIGCSLCVNLGEFSKTAAPSCPLYKFHIFHMAGVKTRGGGSWVGGRHFSKTFPATITIPNKTTQLLAKPDNSHAVLEFSMKMSIST